MVRDRQRHPAGQAMSHSPQSRLRQARCTATSDDEHAVWMVRLGPRRLNWVGYPRCQKVLVVLQEQAELLEVESLRHDGVLAGCDDRLCSR